MTQIPSINPNTNSATYNAVKIQINDPKTNVREGFKSSPNDNGVYNAVSIEVNRPSVETAQKPYHRGVYDYPEAKSPVTSDIAPIHPVSIPELPVLPVAYQTNNFVNNKTLINAEFEFENEFALPKESQDIASEELSVDEDLPGEEEISVADADEQVAVESESEPIEAVAVMEEYVVVPEPNVTTTEDQKIDSSEVTFNGLSFKADSAKQPIEIVPPVDIKPDVDVAVVLDNLSSPDFDVQAKQMEEIARVSMEDPQKAVPYVVTEIFSELINIVKKDTSDLIPPSEKQIETRKQIIINEIVKEQAKVENQDVDKIELPFKLDEKDVKEASNLSSMEQAERNKEYALYTMSILAKVYTDEVEKHTGNVVPLTDLPGVSAIVDTLRQDANAGVKIASIDALRYINRPEYQDELNSVLTLATNDPNPYVARSAALALESLK